MRLRRLLLAAVMGVVVLLSVASAWAALRPAAVQRDPLPAPIRISEHPIVEPPIVEPSPEPAPAAPPSVIDAPKQPSDVVPPPPLPIEDDDDDDDTEGDGDDDDDG